jgi:hypothetical protein
VGTLERYDYETLQDFITRALEYKGTLVCPSFPLWAKVFLSTFDERETGTLVELNKRRESYTRELREIWREETQDVHLQRNLVDSSMRKEMEKEHGIDTLPFYVREKVWVTAWENGNACGWHEVTCYYAEIAELVHTVWEEAKAHFTSK